MTTSDDLFRVDTFVNLNTDDVVPNMDSSINSETLLMDDNFKGSDDVDMSLVEASSSDQLTSRNTYVLTLSKEGLATIQGTILTLPILKSSEGVYLNTTEPPLKITKIDSEITQHAKEQLVAIKKGVLNRLKRINDQLDAVLTKCQHLEGKVENLMRQTNSSSVDESLIHRKSKSLSVDISSQVSADFPKGSWLGDPNNPDLRVRCCLSQKDLDSCNRMCTTAEKMSLTLLDCLFDRETQAFSNISGTGKHGKKQLDPLMIYGIRCHLIHTFGISEKDWHRIRQNLDSKCRTAYRRKKKGMPLTIKGIRERHTSSDGQEMSSQVEEPSQTDSALKLFHDADSKQSFSVPDSTFLDNKQDGETNSASSIKMESTDIDSLSLQIHKITESQIIHTEEHEDIHVLNATPEQLVALKETHDLQIFADGSILHDIRIQDISHG